MMIKPITTSLFTKKFVATTMFATSVLVANSASLVSQVSDNNLEQVELCSEEVAKALQAKMLNIHSTGFEHNDKLDNLYIKFCDQDLSKRNRKAKLKDLYEEKGLCGGTIELQRALDDVFITKALKTHQSHFSLSNYERNIIGEQLLQFQDWKKNKYYPKLNELESTLFKNSNIPTVSQTINIIDNHINNGDFFLDADKKIYNDHSKIFQSKQSEKGTVQALSELLAYKVHLLNILAFYNYFSRELKIQEISIFMYYFTDIFVNGESAIEP